MAPSLLWFRITIAGTLLSMAGAAAAAPAFPWDAPEMHLGVATCAGSNCHGASKPLNETPVLQNEYTTWERQDAHSNAYKVLLAPASKRIVANLGYAKPAHESVECLTCHSDYVPVERRGRRFKLSDGVGCEACHGGSEKWLGPHVSSATHAQNVAQGLYPLPQPAARARLCLDCHMGSTRKPIDHRMMGAGHPPLSFELDTFTNIQPAHFRVDRDYTERKGAADGLRLWALGQLVATEAFLDGLLSERFVSHGLFPELMFFDCNACHHPMRPPRWQAGVAGANGPGHVRLFNANLSMSTHVIAVLAPDRLSAWRTGVGQLHAASTVSVAEIKKSAAALRAGVPALIAQVETTNVNAATAQKILQAMVASGIDRDAGDYTAAQQIAMGLEGLNVYLASTDSARSQALRPALDRIFSAVETADRYDADGFRAGLSLARDALK